MNIVCPCGCGQESGKQQNVRELLKQVGLISDDGVTVRWIGPVTGRWWDDRREVARLYRHLVAQESDPANPDLDMDNVAALIESPHLFTEFYEDMCKEMATAPVGVETAGPIAESGPNTTTAEIDMSDEGKRPVWATTAHDDAYAIAVNACGEWTPKRPIAVAFVADQIRALVNRRIADSKSTERDQALPMQPFIRDPQGTVRFRANAVVRTLLDRATEKGVVNFLLSIVACIFAMAFGLILYAVWAVHDAAKHMRDHHNDPDVKAERERQKRWRDQWRKP